MNCADRFSCLTKRSGGCYHFGGISSFLICFLLSFDGYIIYHMEYFFNTFQKFLIYYFNIIFFIEIITFILHIFPLYSDFIFNILCLFVFFCLFVKLYIFFYNLSLCLILPLSLLSTLKNNIFYCYFFINLIVFSPSYDIIGTFKTASDPPGIGGRSKYRDASLKRKGELS